MVHPRLENGSSASLHHVRAREGEEIQRGRGASKLETGCEMKRKERKGVLYREGGWQMKGFDQLMALNAY